MLKRLFSHTAIYGLAPQIPKIATIFALPIITKYLTSVDFAVYGVVTAVVSAMVALRDLGLRVILSTSFYRSPLQHKWRWRQIYGFLTLWSLPFSVLLAVSIYISLPMEANGDVWLIILINVIPVLVFGPSWILGSLHYQLRQRPFPIAIRSVIFGVLTVGLNVYFIVGLKMGYMGWFLSMGISTFLNQASYWWPLNHKFGMAPILNFKWRYIKRALKIGLPTVPRLYASYIMDSSDQLVMRALDVSTENIGKYNAAYYVGKFVQQIGVAAGRAISPMLYQSYKEGDEHIERNLIFTLQICFLCMTFSISIWMKEAFNLLISNETLATMYPLGIIIVMAYNYRPMYFGANTKLFYLEKTKVTLKVALMASALNLILNFALIGVVGYKIAAYSTYLSLMVMGYAGYYIKEYKESHTLKFYPLFWFTITVLLTIIAYFSVELNYLEKGVLTLSFMFAGLFALRKINRRGLILQKKSRN